MLVIYNWYMEFKFSICCYVYKVVYIFNEVGGLSFYLDCKDWINELK